MKNIIVLIILMLILGSAIYYIITQKKKGAKCIGCPYAKNCKGHCKSK